MAYRTLALLIALGAVLAGATPAAAQPAAVGESVVGQGRLPGAPELIVASSGGNDVVAVGTGQSPVAYRAGDGEVSNACLLDDGLGFSDVGSGDFSFPTRKHEYTFSLPPGMTFTHFAVTVLDWGDFLPYGQAPNDTLGLRLTAFNPGGEIVATQSKSFTSDSSATYNRPSQQHGDLGQAGDACRAADGQPGRAHFSVPAPGATRLTLRFDNRQSMDPEIALDGVEYTIAQDADHDGWWDSEDNCPHTPNPGQSDSDGDGVGDACQPIFSADPSSVDFGRLALGASSQRTLTVSNAGSGSLQISSSALAGAAAADFRILADGCSGGSLADGETCALGIRFAPSQAGERRATLRFDHSASGSPHVVDLVGTAFPDADGDGHADAEDNCPDTPNPGQQDSDGNGIGDACQPRFAAEPASLSFGRAAVTGTSRTSVQRTVTVRNSGAGLLGISSIAVVGVNAGDFGVTSDGCSGRSLAAGATCSVSVRFRPATTGHRTAALRLHDSAPGSPHSVPLAGTACMSYVSFVFFSSWVGCP